MDFQNLDEYYEYLENDTNFQYLDLNTYKYITALRDKIEDKNTKKLCSYEKNNNDWNNILADRFVDLLKQNRIISFWQKYHKTP